MGEHTSLALDAAGRPHISYCFYDPGYEACYTLKYAHFDGSFGETSWRFGFAESHGTAWIIETVDSAIGADVGWYTSLALDANDHPHISYYDWAGAALKYAWGEQCVPVAEASIEGPTVLPVGQTGLYTATYAPPTATLPVTITWDSGTTGPTTAYSWTLPGVYTITVTATNPCSQAMASRPVTVTDEPIAGLSATNDGPTTLGDPTTITATLTAGSNVSFTWAFGDGTTGSGAVLTHTYPAALSYTAVVTASNEVSTMTATTVVTIIEPAPPTYHIYLPVVLRGF